MGSSAKIVLMTALVLVTMAVFTNLHNKPSEDTSLASFSFREASAQKLHTLAQVAHAVQLRQGKVRRGVPRDAENFRPATLSAPSATTSAPKPAMAGARVPRKDKAYVVHATAKRAVVDVLEEVSHKGISIRQIE